MAKLKRRSFGNFRLGNSTKTTARKIRTKYLPFLFAERHDPLPCVLLQTDRQTDREKTTKKKDRKKQKKVIDEIVALR